MIKVANNIQHMLEKQAEGPGQSINQERRPSSLPPRGRIEWAATPDSWRALEAARNSPGFQSPGFVQEPPTNMGQMLPEYNLFSGLQDSIQEAVQRNPYNMNVALSNLDRGYDGTNGWASLAGPYDSIPEFLRNAKMLANDAQQAVGPLAQDYGTVLNQGGQFLNQVGNRIGNAANYVEQQLPAAANTAQSFVNSANQFRAGVAPAAQQASQTVNNAVQGVAGRLGSLGRGILDNARMIGTGFPVPTMPQPAPIPLGPGPGAPAPRPVPVPGPNSA